MKVLFGSLAILAIGFQLSNAIFFSKGGWGSPPGWGWGGGDDGGHHHHHEEHHDEGGAGWGWDQPKVVETHKHIHKVHHYDTHEKRIKNFDHHEHKVHEHNKHKKVIFRDHLHKHNVHVHTVHQKNLHQHNIHQHNVHKHNLHVVKVHEPVIHQYNKHKSQVIPSVHEVTKVIPINEVKHQTFEHHEESPPVVLEHKGWGAPPPASDGWGASEPAVHAEAGGEGWKR